MKKGIITLIGILLYVSSFSQLSLIARQSNGTTSIYSNLNTCVTEAVSGDTIYLPGGTISISTLTIDKQLTIIGVGHYPDSTAATGKTTLQGSIRYITGSDNSFLTGIYLTGTLYFGSNSTNHDVNNVLLTRSSFQNLYLTYNGNTMAGNSTILNVDECVIRTRIQGNTKVLTMTRSFLNDRIYYLTSSTFENCVFLRRAFYALLHHCTDLTFNNCIIKEDDIFDNTTSIIFNNCIFEQAFTFPQAGGDAFASFFGYPLIDEFENQTGTVFSYAHDYHLKATSVGKNAGTDGTDIGIYGTSEPYKEGAVPFNPHFQIVNIDDETDVDGNLNIQIRVSAQDK